MKLRFSTRSLVIFLPVIVFASLITFWLCARSQKQVVVSYFGQILDGKESSFAVLTGGYTSWKNDGLLVKFRCLVRGETDDLAILDAKRKCWRFSEGGRSPFVDDVVLTIEDGLIRPISVTELDAPVRDFLSEVDAQLRNEK